MTLQLKLNAKGVGRCVLLLFVGAYLIVLTPFVFINLNVSQSVWNRLVSVPASVKSTALHEIVHRHKLGSNSDFCPVVNYDYELAGKHYSSSRVYFGDIVGGKDWAESLVKQNCPGQIIRVWVDPENPTFACIIKKKNFTDYVVAIFLALFACIIALVFIVLLIGPGQEATSPERKGRSPYFIRALAVMFIGAVFLVGCLYSYFLYFVGEEHPEILGPIGLGTVCLLAIFMTFKGASKNLTDT